MKKEEEDFIEEREKKGFDHVWDRLPHISAYQFWITTFPSVASLVGGFLSIYPVFAQYKVPINGFAFKNWVVATLSMPERTW